MSTVDDYFFKQFVAERKKTGLSQEEAAAKCGVGRQMWGKYERGETYPSSEVLLNFAKIGADVSSLFQNVQKINHLQQENRPYVTGIDQLINAYDLADEAGKKALLTIADLIKKNSNK